MLLTILLWNIVVCNAHLENIRITPRKLSWLNAHGAAESIDQQTAKYESKKVSLYFIIFVKTSII